MKEFLDLHTDLIINLDNVYLKFLKRHRENPLSTPEEYNDDVKAYCILSHAYLEEYFEVIAMKVMSISLKLFEVKKEITSPLLTLLSYSNHRYELLADTGKVRYKSVNERLRSVIDSTKTQFSAEIHHNHGVSENYLRKILGPVSIDVPQNPNLLNSLVKLADARGSYAHMNAKRTLAPEDAKNYVEDCILISIEVNMKVINMFYSDEAIDYKNQLVLRLITLLHNRIRIIGWVLILTTDLTTHKNNLITH